MTGVQTCALPICKTEINKVYDPACGSGSLLLKAEKVLGKDKIRNGFYGQEINITTYNLCRINMFLHDIGFIERWPGGMLTNFQTCALPIWDDEPFELIVSIICSWMVFFIPFHKKFYTYLHLNIKIKMHALRS